MPTGDISIVALITLYTIVSSRHQVQTCIVVMPISDISIVAMPMGDISIVAMPTGDICHVAMPTGGVW